MNNSHSLPLFSTINPATIEKNLDQVLTENRTQLTDILKTTQNTWETLVQPLEVMSNRLHQFWSPINHLHAVKQNPELRTAYQACLPKLTDYYTEISQNADLYKAFVRLAESSTFQQLNKAQQKVVNNYLRDFRLSGVGLPPEKKKRYADIQTELAELSNRFSEHLLDATGAWTKHITDKNLLNGVPEHVLSVAQEAAKAKGLEGWLLTLEFPCYSPVMTYAVNRQLREEMYIAYSTRASEQGPNAKQFDNSEIMANILRLRHELSVLLGFKNYAELSLATKMVKNPDEVMVFLNNLVEKSRPKSIAELKELQEFAKDLENIKQLEAWDIAYYGEKLLEARYSISDEMLRPYFPAPKVLNGMFNLVNILYGIQVKALTGIDTWHPDVQVFAIYDANNNLRGYFYLDLYARSNKRDGAWMDDCQSRWHLPNQTVQPPIAFLTCNLTLPTADNPSLLTHDEVLTLFHEFGHGLHHMLTQVDYLDVAGINGVEWDAVELPSQFMEYFLWEKSVLDFVSSHYQTNQPIPTELFERMLASKHFQAGLQLLRQLEFSLFDFRLHKEYDAANSAGIIRAILQDIYSKISVTPKPVFNRFENSFSHIFGGGYAAGYYSYLWAEVLACDAFAKFKEHGILDPSIGQEFLRCILERGGTQDALDLFIAFRGRKPTIDALLSERGL